MHPSCCVISTETKVLYNRILPAKLIRLSRVLLFCLALGTLGTACTENGDDIECGTPEWPCDQIVTDDMVEVS